MLYFSGFSRIGAILRGFFLISVAISVMLWAPTTAKAQQTIGNVTWSSDGKYLAFYTRWYDDTEIFLLELENNSLLQQTANDAADAGPDFTLDGKHLLFASNQNGDFDIFRVDLTGGKPEKLFGKPGRDERFPFELSDGRIAYASREIKKDKSADPFPFEIHVWNPSTGRSALLANAQSGDMIFRSPNEGDAYLLVSKRSGKNEIYLTDADGAVLRQLTIGETEGGFGSGFPRFSADGTKFLYWSDQNTETPFNFFLQIYDLETDAITVLPRPVRFTALADLSPDGTRIAFAAATEDEGLSGIWHLYTMDIDGSNLRLRY